MKSLLTNDGKGQSRDLSLTSSRGLLSCSLLKGVEQLLIVLNIDPLLREIRRVMIYDILLKNFFLEAPLTF